MPEAEQLPAHHISFTSDLTCFAQMSALRDLVLRIDRCSLTGSPAHHELEETLLSIINSYHFELLPSLEEMLHRSRSLRAWILWMYAYGEKTGESLDSDLRNRLRQRRSIVPGEVEALRIMSLGRPHAVGASLTGINGCSEKVPSQFWTQLVQARIAWLYAQRAEWLKAAASLAGGSVELHTEWHAMQSLLKLIYHFLSKELNLTTTLIEMETLSQRVPNRFVLARFHLELFHHYLRWLNGCSFSVPTEDSWKSIAALISTETRRGLVTLKTLLEGPSPRLLAMIWSLTRLETIDLKPLLASPALAPAGLWIRDALQVANSIQAHQKPAHKQDGHFLRQSLGRIGSRMWILRCELQELLIQMQLRSTRLEVEQLGSQLRNIHLDPSYWRSNLALIEAADHYRSGHFAKCVERLIEARRRATCRELQAIIDLWLATAEGRVSRLLEPQAWARSQSLARLLFAPQLVNLGEGRYRVSGHYEVDLSTHPVINRLLKALLHEHEGGLPAANLQSQVWRQSTSLQGWKQKIRNTIGRLRLHFRFTLVPIVVQDGGLIQLNHEALAIATPLLPRKNEREKELLRLIERGPISSRLLAGRTKIPLSTVKRLLRELLDSRQIRATRHHQTFLYSLNPEQQAIPPTKRSDMPSQLY